RVAAPRRIVAAVKEAAGPAMAVLAKLNMVDGYKGGIWLDDSLEAARLLEADGAPDALELTGGRSLRNPMYLFRGDAPVHEMAAAFPKSMRFGFKLLGPRIF